METTTIKTVIPWDVESLNEFRYFNCPICSYKHKSKQDFVYHTSDAHPECVEYFKMMSDESLCDILCPWNDDSPLIGKEEYAFKK